MSDLWDWVGDNYEAVSATAAMLLVFVVYLQLRLGRRTFKLGDERVKKQSTLEFYASVMDTVKEDRKLISRQYGKDEISSDESRKLYDAVYKAEVHNTDEDLVSMATSVRNYLNALERLAVGVYLGVYDEDILKRVAFYHFHYVRTQFPRYISEVRKENGEAHAEALKLAEEWKAHPPIGGWGGDGSLGNTRLQKALRKVRNYLDSKIR